MTTEMQKKLLEYATHEELHRRQASAEELLALDEITLEALQSLAPPQLASLKTQVLASIDRDLAKCRVLSSHISQAETNGETPTFNLKFHKLATLLNGAKDLINAKWSELTAVPLNEMSPLDPNYPMWQCGSEVSIMGSGTSSFAQMALLKILSVHSGQPIACINALAEANIYQLDVSPNLQSTILPQFFANEELQATYKDWEFFFRDELSPTSGELVYPTMGYAFGGSRDDSRYEDKLFRAEDCSSVLAKWLGAQEPFSTIHLAWLHENCFDPNYEEKLRTVGAMLAQEDPEFMPCIMAAALVMKPKTTAPEAGDIFVFRKYNLSSDPGKENVLASKGGHTGVVTEVSEGGFTSLTYARDLDLVEGHFEGLVYNYETPEAYAERKYWFFEPLNVGEDPFTTLL